MRRAVALSALAAGLLGAVAATPALAAPPPGDFTITYDWTNPQTGFAGVQTLLSAPALETPYYQLSEQPGVGLRLTPAISAGGVADRVFPPIDPVLNPYGGPSLIALVNSPPTTQVRSASFSQLSYRRPTGENQIMRLAIFGPGGSAGLDTRSDAPPPGPFLDDVTYGPATFGTVTLTAPGAAGNTVQAWLFTICGEAPAPPACPTVHFPGGQPDSFGQVGKIQIALHDNQPPAIALGGDLAQGGWTNARTARTLQIAASDQGAGVRTVSVQRRHGPGSPWRTVSTPAVGCDRNHTGPGEPGREAAECPSTAQATFTEQLGKLSDGEWDYGVTVLDDSGRATFKQVTLRIDRQAPRVQLGGPLTKLGGGFLGRSDSATADLQGSDDHAGVRSLELIGRENGGRAQTIALIPACKDPAPCSRSTGQRPANVDLATLADGKDELYAVAHDAAGNSSRPTAVARLLLDRHAPLAPQHVSAKARGGAVDVSFTHDGTDPGGGVRTSGLHGFRVTVTDPTFVHEYAQSPVVLAARGQGGLRHIRLRPSAGHLTGSFVLVQAVDKADNFSASAIAPVKVAKKPIKHPITVHKPTAQKPKRVEYGYAGDKWDLGPPPPAGDQQLTRAKTIGALAAATQHRRGAKQDTFPIRAIFAYDLWARAVGDPPQAPTDDPHLLDGWHEFVQTINAYNKVAAMRHLPPAEPIVTLMSHNFNKCADLAHGLRPVEFPDPGATPPVTEQNHDQLNCPYPKNSAEYKQYFNLWRVRTGNGTAKLAKDDPNKLTITTWGAWNEPDLEAFTLGELVAPPGAPPGTPPPGARLAAEYWVGAKQACPHCNILAGEWATFNSDWVNAYVAYLDTHTPPVDGKPSGAPDTAPSPPTTWTIHAYDALRLGGKRRDTLRDYVDDLQRRHDDHIGSKFGIWITETGAQLRTRIPIPPSKPDENDPSKKTHRDKGNPFLTELNDHAPDQFAAGQALAQQALVTPRLERIFYYGAWGPTSASFDSDLADMNGKLRPVLCGLRGDKKLDRSEKRCPGMVKTVPDPNDPKKKPGSSKKPVAKK